MKPPPSFVVEADNQRYREICGLEEQIEEVRRRKAIEQTLCFEPKSPFWQFALAIVEAHGRGRTIEKVSIHRSGSLPFEESSNWYVFVQFGRDGGCAGADWYEPDERIFDLWEKHR